MSRRKPVTMRPTERKNPTAKRRRARLKRAAKAPREGAGMLAVTVRTKSGAVTLLRSRQGRLTTSRSAAVIDTGTERFAGALKRLASK